MSLTTPIMILAPPMSTSGRVDGRNELIDFAGLQGPVDRVRSTAYRRRSARVVGQREHPSEEDSVEAGHLRNPLRQHWRGDWNPSFDS